MAQAWSRMRRVGMPVAGEQGEGSWLLVGVLSLTVTVSYGVLLYAFPVMLAPMQAELGWSAAVLTSSFSGAMLAAGVAAIPVGRWIDRYGPRRVMTAGSAAAVALLLAWSRVQDPVSHTLVWIGLGGCMAALFYEPAFAVVARRYRTRRARALSTITLVGGLASTLFVPLVSWLVLAVGWRGAVVWLAALLGTLTILPHALLPGAGAPELCGRGNAHEPRSPAGTSVVARAAVRSREFGWLAVAFLLSTVASFAVTVHLLLILLERGFSAPMAAGALALLGLAKLPGRALIAPLTSRWTARSAIVVVLWFQIMGLAVLGTLEDAIGTWIFVALFGAGDGATTPARGELIAALFGPAEYGHIAGVLGFMLSLGRFVAPGAISLAHGVLDGYAGVLWILVVVVMLAVLAMGRVRPGGLAARAACDQAAASFWTVPRLPV